MKLEYWTRASNCKYLVTVTTVFKFEHMSVKLTENYDGLFCTLKNSKIWSSCSNFDLKKSFFFKFICSIFSLLGFKTLFFLQFPAFTARFRVMMSYTVGKRRFLASRWFRPETTPTSPEICRVSIESRYFTHNEVAFCPNDTWWKYMKVAWL